MMFKSGDARGGDLNGFLDRGSEIEGELRFDASFRVDGTVRGAVVSPGDLVVGEDGVVEAEVTVGRIFVTGTVRGSIQAQHQVHVAPGGRVFADLATPSLVIEDGALFEGRCAMSRAGEPTARPGRRPRVVKPLSGQGESR